MKADLYAMYFLVAFYLIGGSYLAYLAIEALQ
jgi:threonine/homoserine/homoserine lactone efflux protein